MLSIALPHPNVFSTARRVRFIAAVRDCRPMPGISSVLACVDGRWKPRLAQFLNPAMPAAASNRQDRAP
jgi:hypothetical protein